MRYERRVCDLCGWRSDLHLVREPRPNTLSPVKSMELRGWTTIGQLDRCPDCTWMDRRGPEEAATP